MTRRRRIEPAPPPADPECEQLNLDDLAREWGQLERNAAKQRHPSTPEGPKP
jgi:hypothetical protein